MTKTDSNAVQAPKKAPTPNAAASYVHEYAPALGWYTDNIAFGNWTRPQLSRRDRSVSTVAALIACGHLAQMTGHFNRALA